MHLSMQESTWCIFTGNNTLGQSEEKSTKGETVTITSCVDDSALNDTFEEKA